MKIRILYKNLVKGFINLFKYFSIIWKDRDWDYLFFFLLLRKKLQSMSSYFEKHSIREDGKKEVKKIDFCIRCLDRLIEDNYFDPDDTLTKKWGDLKFNYEPYLDKGGLFVEINRENIKTSEALDEYWKEWEKLVHLEYYFRERDIKLLFKVISQNVENWWD